MNEVEFEALVEHLSNKGIELVGNNIISKHIMRHEAITTPGVRAFAIWGSNSNGLCNLESNMRKELEQKYRLAYCNALSMNYILLNIEEEEDIHAI